jgi:hypothetical protein
MERHVEVGLYSCATSSSSSSSSSSSFYCKIPSIWWRLQGMPDRYRTSHIQVLYRKYSINKWCFKKKLRNLKEYDVSLRETDISNINDYIFVQLKARMISLTVKHSHEDRKTQNQEQLCWLGPAAIDLIWPTDIDICMETDWHTDAQSHRHTCTQTPKRYSTTLKLKYKLWPKQCN